MRSTSFGTAVVCGAISALLLSVPTSTQSRGGRRDDVQTLNGREVVAREALVRLRRPADAEGLAQVRVEADAEDFQAFRRTGVVRVRSRSLNADQLIALLARRGDVVYVEPNFVVRALDTPNDPSFPQLWGLHNIGQPINGFPGRSGADINAVPAWDISTGSTANVVAVIDTGIDYNHPDLAANMWSAPGPFTVNIGGLPVTCAAGTHGFNALTRTCNPLDDNDHGTHAAGTIGAAGNNGVGVTGVNWTTRLMAIKILDANGSGSVADAIDAIEFAIEAKQAFAATGGANVRVLSNSWGGADFSQALLDAIEAANGADMLFVAAAGNSGSDLDSSPSYPASYDAPNVLTVAATSNADELAWFSNYGATSVHLGAPGVDILSTTVGNSYAYASGTSMATPHVSGAAALVLSRCALDTAGLKDALVGSVESVEELHSTTVAGGRVDVNSAMHSCIAPPPAPANLKARPGDTRVALSWSGSLGATSYTVKRGDTAGGPYVTIRSNVKGTVYVDTAVVNGTTYYYVVSAANPLGQSGDSNEASATPNIPPDVIISSLTSPSTSGAGATIAVTVSTKNQGTGAAAPSTTRFYLSTNPVLDADDRLLAEQAVPQLLPGATSSASLSITIPDDVPTGRDYLIAHADGADVLSEDVETNNTFARSLYVGPDLVASALTVPATAAAGATISVSDTVKNQGGGRSTASRTTFYLSSNAIFDSSDALLAGSRGVPELNAGATSSGSTAVTIPATTPVGTYYVIAKADGEDAVVETQETNNTIARLVRVGGDLVVSALTVPAKAGQGAAIVVSDTTTNQGTGTVTASVTRFYLSVNALYDSSDVLLDGSRAVPELAAAASSSGQTTVTIPPATAAGSYYIVAKADADNAVVETQETNNALARGIQIGSDLVVSVLTVPAKAAPGASIVASDTTTNQGAGTATASVTRLYFSSNNVLDAGDVLLAGAHDVPQLAGGSSHSAATTVMIPPATAPGTYYVLATADGDKRVAESAEGNNTTARSISIGGDLVISAFSAPATSGAGSSITVSETNTNQGTATVAGSVTRFYLSVNSLLDAADVLLAGSRAVPELGAGASSSGSTVATIPAGTPSGIYYIIAKADADLAVPETQEQNNVSARTLTVGPDLTVSALSAPAKGAAGSPIVITDTTTNQGGGAAGVSVTEFYLSNNSILDASDVALGGSRAVGQLAPGAGDAASTTVTLPAGIAAGTFYVIAKADTDNTVTETQEGNNTSWRTIRIGPDLTVSSIALSSTSLVAGASVTITATVTNIGAGAAGPSTTRFYLSVNLTLDAADLALDGSRSVPALAGDAASSGPTSVTIPAGTAPGSYFLLGKADADNAVGESLETNNVTARGVQVTAAP